MIAALLLAGCAHAPAVAPPPPPPVLATSPVTFVWTPMPDPCWALAQPCRTYQMLACNDVDLVDLSPGVDHYTLSLPIGFATCALMERIEVQGGRLPILDVIWAGTVHAGSQTAALRLPTG